MYINYTWVPDDKFRQIIKWLESNEYGNQEIEDIFHGTTTLNEIYKMYLLVTYECNIPCLDMGKAVVIEALLYRGVSRRGVEDVMRNIDWDLVIDRYGKYSDVVNAIIKTPNIECYLLLGNQDLSEVLLSLRTCEEVTEILGAVL